MHKNDQQNDKSLEVIKMIMKQNFKKLFNFLKINKKTVLKQNTALEDEMLTK